MKKGILLNQPVSSVIAGMGHMDELVIADAGLPIPATTRRIDLALTKNVPSFAETLRVVLNELQVEQGIVAAEIASANPDVLREIRELLGPVPLETVAHDAFKRRTGSATAIIRTGEFSPYANIILVAGVVF